MRRWIICAVMALATMAPANSSTYLIDASIGGTTSPAGQSIPGIYQTPQYSVNPGDIVDLGSVTLLSYVFNCCASQPVAIKVSGQLAVSYNFSTPLTGGEYCDSGNCPDTAETRRLLFTVPEDVSLLWVTWTLPYEYVSPFAASAPEPSTWAMLLIGFAGIGFMSLRSYRTRRCL